MKDHHRRKPQELTTRQSGAWNIVLTLANERIPWSRAVAQRSRIHWNAHFIGVTKVTSLREGIGQGKGEPWYSYHGKSYLGYFCCDSFRIDCYKVSSHWPSKSRIRYFISIRGRNKKNTELKLRECKKVNCIFGPSFCSSYFYRVSLDDTQMYFYLS